MRIISVSVFGTILWRHEAAVVLSLNSSHLMSIQGPRCPLSSVSLYIILPENKWYYRAGINQQVCVLIWVFHFHEGNVLRSAVWIPDRSTLAACGAHQYVWRYTNSKKNQSCRSHEITSCCCHDKFTVKWISRGRKEMERVREEKPQGKKYLRRCL